MNTQINAGPLTLPEVQAMDSATYDWHYRHNREALELALKPPPPLPAPPAPPTTAELRSKQAAELVVEFRAWLKNQNMTEADEMGARDLQLEAFMNSKQAEVAQVEMEKECRSWADSHPDYIKSDSNRKVLEEYLLEHGLMPTIKNLDAAFEAVKGELLLDASKLPYDPNEPDTRVGGYRNGRFEPYDPGNSQNTVKRHLVGQSTPGATEDVAIRKDPRRMNSREYEEACRVSPTFRERENAK